MGRHWGDPIFYVSDGTSYQASGIAFGSGDRHTCAWGEANGDGRPDLFCTTGAKRGRGKGPNQLWLQDATGGFSDVAKSYGVRDSLGRGRSVNWIDYDLDGDLDLFVGNKRRDGSPNVMYKNMRGQFKKAKVGLGHHLAPSLLRGLTGTATATLI